MTELAVVWRFHMRHGVGQAESEIFAPCKRVVRQESDAGYSAQGSEKPSGGLQVGVGIVAAGNERYAYLDRRPAFRKKTQIVQDRPVRLSGEFAVYGGVRMFEIDEKQIGYRKNRPESFPRNETAGVKRSVNSVFLERGEKRLCELRLNKRFSAGESYAAAGFPVKRAVLQCETESFFHRGAPPVQFQSPAGTFRVAAPAGFAEGRGEFVLSRPDRMRVLRTQRDTFAAMEAFVCVTG